MKKRTFKKLGISILALGLCLAVAVPVFSGYYDGWYTNVLAKGVLRVLGVARFDASTMTVRGVTYTLPSADGTEGQQITTDGSGTVSWSSRPATIQLPLMGFVTTNADPAISGTSGPGIQIDDNIPNLVWADGETTPGLITFRVPEDYSSGGAFKLLATESDSTTPNQVDFDVYVNADNTAIDASATNQTPVALAGTTTTPDQVTLTVATDFGSLTAGNWITLRVWRDDVADGTGDLEVKGVAFYYTAKATE